MEAARSLSIVSLALLLTACSGRGGGGGVSVVQPTSLAGQTRATSVSLTWVDDSASETGFAIERADGTGEFQRIAQLDPNVTRYDDRRLQPVASYSYRVHAMVPGGTEILSAVLNVATTQPSFTTVTPPTAFTIGGERVTIRGDGFSAGVDEILFNGRRAKELEIVDDSTVACTTPASVTAGLARVIVITPTATTQQTDKFTFYTWPPVHQPPENITGSTGYPDRIQSVSNGTLTHILWNQSQQRQRAIFVSRGRKGTPWEEPIRVDHGKGQPWHPHLAVDGDDVYAVWVDLGSLYLVKSVDGGTTWSKQNLVPGRVGAVFHPKIVATGQRVHVLWTDERVGSGQLYHNYSINGGKSFQRQAVRVNTKLGVRNLQVAAVGQHVYLLWWNPRDLGGIFFNRSTDGGVTWAARDQRLAFEPGTVPISPPQLTAANGHLYVLAPEEGNRRVSIIRSSDGGNTWNKKQQLSRTGQTAQMPRMAVTKNGTEVYVVWHAPNIPGVELNRSVDAGASFLKSPVRVAVVPGTNSTAPVVCCSGGVVTVAFASGTHNSEVYVSNSSDWGLRWSPVQRLGSSFTTDPAIHCHGADVVVRWLTFPPLQNKYEIRAVRTSER